jgi:hypothetical protein
MLNNSSLFRICRILNICKDEKCNIFTPKNLQNLPEMKQNFSKEFQNLKLEGKEEWWKQVLKFFGYSRLIKVFENHVPFTDKDDDFFSQFFGFRGSAWRGKGSKMKIHTFRL